MRYLHTKLQKKTALLGVDIGASAIKLLELEQIAGQYRVGAYANIALSGPVTLTSALRQTKITARSAVIAMPDDAVITKTIQLSQALKPFEIEQHITLEADRYFNQDIRALYFDYEILGENAQQSGKIDVRLAAAWRKDVLPRLGIITAAGLRVTAVDIESFALARATQVPFVSPRFLAVPLELQQDAAAWALCLGLALWRPA